MPQRGGRLPQEVSLTGEPGRREQQQRLRVRGQLPNAPQEGRLEPVADGQRLGSGIRPPSWSGVSSRAASTTASGLPPVSATMRAATGGSIGRLIEVLRSSYAACSGRPQMRRLRQGLQARLGVRRLPHGEEQPDTVGEQPARDEAEEVGRLLVEPMRVVDHAQHGPGLGGVGQQREHRQADEERIGRRSGHQTEGHAQRPALRLGQAVHGGQERHEQLVDGGEAEVLLRLDGHHADDLHVSRELHSVAEQRRLAHARLTAEHQRTAHPPAGRCRSPR